MISKKQKKITGTGFTFPARLFLILFPLLSMIVCLLVGRLPISLPEFFKMIGDFFRGTVDRKSMIYVTLFRVRLPRILLAMIVGAALSVSGMIFQSFFANPLATPDTVGVAGGASFGVALGLLLSGSLLTVSLFGFGFGILAAVLTIATGSGRRRMLSSVVLAGIMIGSLFSALVSLIKFLADSETKLPEITYFLMGSFTSASYERVLFGLVPTAIVLIFVFLFRWRFNLLSYSEDEVRSFGVNMKKLRIAALSFATVLTAVSVSLCGQVGWIGLLVPHMCRMKFKNNYRLLLPASVSIGSGFMAIVDTAARSISASEIPVSILTAIIGAPFFIYLMRKSGGWKL